MRTTLCCSLMLVALALAGCGDDPPTRDEAAPFLKAVEEYLAAQSMGMKVTRFQSLDIKDDTAAADVRMALKDDIYAGLKPVWHFTFKKTGGAWQVAACKQ